ncbi:hypothetical protein FIBSPDRAFT_947534 [Athelia psychrophila]|uniref:Uncharacterized protein n=1 Tax=Athelia psychrophila TaxID=1759441 RepID=A0A166RVM4_9AGAM|nr:hypothetical protein FIBSPDRAFT_947534 [Fibularhizoctonia sp. CBS 109695]
MRKQPLGSAAAFEAVKAYKYHVAANGKPPSHAEAKKLLAGFAGAVVDRGVETRAQGFGHSPSTATTPTQRSMRRSWVDRGQFGYALRAAFRDPASPYHIKPGTQGPASPDEPTPHEHLPLEFTSASEPLSPAADAIALARTKLIERGYDPTSFWEQPIVWGHHDALQHVNNVHYVRFFESIKVTT